MIATASWYQNLAEPLRRVYDRAIEFLPSLIGAVALILIGWLAGRLLGLLARRLTRYGLERLGRTASFEAGMEKKPRYRSLPGVLGGLVFWIVFLFFVAAGIEALGLRAVSDLFAGTTMYLPRVIVATVVIFAAILLGDFARRWVARSATGMGIGFAESIGRAVQAVLMVLAVMIAIDQLGVESTVLVMTLAIVVGSGFAATALAFGLGAGPTVGNIIAAHYVQRSYRVGDRVRIGEHEGPIVEISRTAVILEGPQGRAQVPARRFIEEVSVLLPPGS